MHDAEPATIVEAKKHELWDFLHELHEKAGRPSLGQIKLRGGPVPGTASPILNRQSVPTMDTIRKLMKAWGGDKDAVDRAAEILGEICQAEIDQRVAERGRKEAAESSPLAEHPYTAVVRNLAPEELENRDDELAELSAFCSRSDSSYLWVRGKRTAGKTGLMAAFVVKYRPALAHVVSFFVTGTEAGQADATAYIEEITGQLCAVIGEPLPAPAVRRNRLPYLYAQAAAEACRLGRQLVLVVDGIDEDRGGLQGGLPSIASLLPRQDAGLKVIVAGRSKVALPPDVDDHPLARCPVLALRPSPQATGTIEKAQRELAALNLAGTPHGHLIGLIAASGGGLSRRDLQELMRIDAFALKRLVDAGLGGIVTDRGGRLRFCHEAIREAAVEGLGAGIGPYRKSIHDWADRYRELHWPDDTPRYLLAGYPNMLQLLGDRDTMVRWAIDPARHRWLLAASRGEALVLAQIDAAMRAASRAPALDLPALTRLAYRRATVLHRSLHIPTRLPAVLARLDRTERAETLVGLIGEPNRRDAARRAVDAAREPDRWPEVNRQLCDLAARPRSTTARRVAAGIRAVTDFRQRAAAVAQLFETLVKARLWHLAVRYVAETTDPDEQAEARACLLHALIAAGHRRDAARLVENVDDIERQAQAQAARAAALARHGRLADAEDAARSITEHQWRAPALMAVAVRGPAPRVGALTSEAEATAEKAATPDARVRALTAMCVTAAEAGRYRLAKPLLRRLAEEQQRDHARFLMARAFVNRGDTGTAVTVARSIQNAYRKAQTLARLVPQVAADDPALAQDLIGQISNGKLRLSAATGLLQALLTAPGGSTDPAAALALAGSLLPDPEQRVQLTANCLPVLAGATWATLVTTADEMIAGIADEAGRARALTALAEAAALAGDHALAEDLVGRAEREARSVPLLPEKTRDLIALTRATAPVAPGRALELAGRAKALLHRITAPNTQLRLLAELIKAIHPAARPAACLAGREFTDPYRRASLMAELAGAAMDAGHPEIALAIARSVPEGRYRAAARVACARGSAAGVEAGHVRALLAEAQRMITGGQGVLDILAAAVACRDDQRAQRLYRELEPPDDARALLKVIEAVRGINHPGRMANLQSRFAAAAARLPDPVERLRAAHRLVYQMPADRIHDSVRELVGAALTETTDARRRAIFELAFAGLAGPGAPDEIPSVDDLDGDDLRLLMQGVTRRYGPDAAHVRVRAMGDAARRDSALRAVIGEVLRAAAHPDTLTQAYAAAQDLANADYRAESLTRLARHAPAGWADVPNWISEGVAAASDVRRAYRRGRLLAGLAVAAAACGARGVSADVIDASLRAAEEVTDPAEAAKIFGALAEAAALCGEPARAADLLAQAVSSVPLARPPGWSDDAVELLARAVAEAGDVAHAAALARTLDDRQRAARVLQTLAHLVLKADRPVRAQALMHLVDDPAGRVRGLTSLVCAASSAGKHPAAEALLTATLTALDEITDGPARDDVAPAVVKAAAEAEYDDRASAVLASIRDPQQRDLAVLEMVRALTERGDADGARELAAELTDPDRGSPELSALDRETPERAVPGEATSRIPEPEPRQSVPAVPEPDPRQAVAEALLNGDWTTALPRLGRIDPDALLAVVDDILRAPEPVPVPAH